MGVLCLIWLLASAQVVQGRKNYAGFFPFNDVQVEGWGKLDPLRWGEAVGHHKEP